MDATFSYNKSWCTFKYLDTTDLNKKIRVYLKVIKGMINIPAMRCLKKMKNEEKQYI